ncbi:MAG TPA: hypothetical protein VMA34_06805 [Terracidiphilus sp.]|nr:hypothetical protein [Terracidiphilus sp.]
MSTPKRPLVTYLYRDGDESAVCDPQLLAGALQYRMDHQLMKPEDFFRNITVWKLVHKDNSVEYYPRENDSDEAGFKKAVKLRRDKGMTAREAKKDALAFPTNSGIHSEVNVVAEIYRRPDIASGSTRIAQVFTERAPCGACQAFMKTMFPRVASTPFYYYLKPGGTERRFQTRPYGGSVMLYLLNRYGV